MSGVVAVPNRGGIRTTIARVGRAVGRVVQKSGALGWFGLGGATYRLLWPDNFWQQGLSPPLSGASALSFPAVYASIDVISSDIARLPFRHWRDDGTTREEVRNSAPLRVLDQPNDYQTGFDLMKSLIASQLFRGNGYLYPLRNKRNEIDTLHCLFPDHVRLYRAAGPDYFYRVSAEPLAELEDQQMVPARNMFHHRMWAPMDPLVGVTPLVAAMVSTETGLAILRQSAKFFTRMARPSGALTTPGQLTPDQADRIKERWRRVYAGEEGAGDVAVLEQGLEWKPLTMTAVDAQLIEQLRYSAEDVARVYRVPLFMLGDLTKATYSSSEQLSRIYWQGCLSAHMRRLEQGLSHFFGLDGRREYVEFDLDALFRTEMQARIEALAKSVQGGIRTPNEARRLEGLNALDGGDQIYMQQQMVPVSTLATRTDLAPKPAQVPGPLPAAPPARELIAVPTSIDLDELSDAISRAVFNQRPAPRRLPAPPSQQRRMIHGRSSRAA